MVYVDFDGVILDTEELLFRDWRKKPNYLLLPEEEKIRYIQGVDWESVLKYSEIISDSVYYLNHTDPKNSIILTRIHSMRNEGTAKVRWIRENHIKQTIVLAPYTVSKTDMVDAEGNILVDDCLKNLDDWVTHGGTPVFF